MATKHRKLFPALASANQTVDCPEFCDTSCPISCYPYADYFFIPPPPPPPPPHHPFSPPERQISPYVIIIVALLASLFLLISYYVIVAKSCSGWCRSSNNRQQQQEEAQAEDLDEEFLAENQVHHPIWFITTVGLQQSIINAITVCKYKKGEGLIEGTECSVCLSEFQQDETLRLLPKCNHAFHISCIDTWLRSHVNCPLCRAHIVNEAAVTNPLISVNPNLDQSTVSGTQIENSELDTESGNIQERSESRAEADEGDERMSKELVNSSYGENLLVMCDCCDNCKVVENDARALRRSSSTAESMSLAVSSHSPEGSSTASTENAENRNNSILVSKRDCNVPESFKRTGSSSSISQCLHKSPVSMKRSFSCGGRFPSSGRNRSITQAILRKC